MQVLLQFLLLSCAQKYRERSQHHVRDNQRERERDLDCPRQYIQLIPLILQLTLPGNDEAPENWEVEELDVDSMDAFTRAPWWQLPDLGLQCCPF